MSLSSEHRFIIGRLPTMEILQVSSAESWGGGEHHVADLTRALVSRGHHLHLAVRPATPLRDALSNLPICWHELPLRNAADLGSARRLAAIVQHEKIDAVHAHLARDYAICGVALRRQTAKLFLTRHHFHEIRSNPLYRWSISNVTRLIAVSRSVAEKLRRAFPDEAEKIVVIPNWIDPALVGSVERTAAREALAIERRLAIATIGQLSPIKRQDLFIQAASRLLEENGEADVEFLVIGTPGDQDFRYEAELHDLARRLQVGIRFTGQVENLATLMRGLDVVVAASVDEGFSLVIAEAMASGCSVVASRAGGMAEIVDDGRTGILVEPGNCEELVAALRRLISDQSLREGLGAPARAEIRERFDRERIIDQIEELYRNG
jgi:glycosyltransferase involved in cell wall biosynthesis